MFPVSVSTQGSLLVGLPRGSLRGPINLCPSGPLGVPAKPLCFAHVTSEDFNFSRLLDFRMQGFCFTGLTELRVWAVWGSRLGLPPQVPLVFKFKMQTNYVKSRIWDSTFCYNLQIFIQNLQNLEIGIPYSRNCYKNTCFCGLLGPRVLYLVALG